MAFAGILQPLGECLAFARQFVHELILRLDHSLQLGNGCRCNNSRFKSRASSTHGKTIYDVRKRLSEFLYFGRIRSRFLTEVLRYRLIRGTMLGFHVSEQCGNFTFLLFPGRQGQCQLGRLRSFAPLVCQCSAHGNLKRISKVHILLSKWQHAVKVIGNI